MKKVFGSVLLLFTFIILALSVRGIAGNPSPQTLNTLTWKENGPFELSPERGRFTLTYSLLEDKSFYFSVPLARFVMPDLGYKDGKYVSLFAPGVSYMTMPGYLIGRYFGSAQAGTYAVIALFALANAYLIYKIVVSLGGHGVAGILAGGTFLFATPGYAYAVNLYQHHVSTFLIVASLYLVINFRTFWSLFLIWLLCGLSIPVDYPNLVLMLPIGLYAAGDFFEITQKLARLEIKMNLLKILSLVSLLAPLAFFLWFNQQSYGHPLQFSGTVESVERIDELGNSVPLVEPTAVELENKLTEEPHAKSITGFFQPRKMVNGLYILLLSPDRGLLTFTPVLLLSLLGLFALHSVRPKETVLMLSVFVANVILYTMWSDPWGGWAFGARYLIPGFAVLSIFVGMALSRYSRSLLVLPTFLLLLSYSVYINTAGALSTSANPPQVQVLSLEQLSGRVEKYSFDRNIDFLKYNTSKSFVYKTWAKDYLSSWQYFMIITSSLVTVSTILCATLYGSRSKQS